MRKEKEVERAEAKHRKSRSEKLARLFMEQLPALPPPLSFPSVSSRIPPDRNTGCLMQKYLPVLFATDQLEAQLHLASKHKEFITADSVGEVCAPLAVQPGDQCRHVGGTQLSGSVMTALWSRIFELFTCSLIAGHFSCASLHSS